MARERAAAGRTRGSTTDRAQSGLDRLLVFVLAVVAVLVVAPHVLGLAGIDVGPRQTVDDGTTADHDIVVLEARGTAVEGDTVGAVRLVVTPAPDRTPVDLAGQLTVWVGGRTSYLSPTGGEGADLDGRYRAAVLDGDGAVLSSSTDRGELVFDLGDDDVADVPEFGRPLAAGETVAVTVVTPRGETLTRRLEVPERLDGETVPL